MLTGPKASKPDKMADNNTSVGNSGNVPASNPLSKKLNKILETRLDNDKVFEIFILKLTAVKLYLLHRGKSSIVKMWVEKWGN